MRSPNSQLLVKKSKIPGAGKGLFTKLAIPKDTLIIEYQGNVQTWNEVKEDIDNDYIYYISSKHVINAKPVLTALARYANDAEGRAKLPGLRNNAKYHRIGKQVFIKAVKDIPAGSEIFVSYGKEYWDQDVVNLEIAEQKKKKKR